MLLKTQNTFGFPACRLPDAAWSDGAVLLVELVRIVFTQNMKSMETYYRRLAL
jgi:hypothetical protein